MTDDELERSMLSRARSSLSPSPADRERVRGALARQLALGPLTDSTGDVAAAGDAASRVGLWVSRLAAVALVAAGSGGAYLAGHRAGVAEGRAQSATEASKLESAPRPSENDRLSPPAPSPETLATAHEPAERRAAPRATAPAVAPEHDAGLDGSPGLDAEVRLLKRVELALRDHNPRFALGLLGELDRTVPGGQLAEERNAARVMARCQLGEGSRALAEQFSKAHPGSAYASRVAETCRETSEQRIQERADTHP